MMNRMESTFGRKAVSVCASLVLAVSLVPAPAFAGTNLGAGKLGTVTSASVAGDLHYVAGTYE